MQKKNNFLPFAVLLFVLVLICVAAIKYTVVTRYVDDFKEVAGSPVQKPLIAPEGMVAIKGMVFSGAQVQGENAYCADGLYIRVDEGTAGVTPGSMIALREKSGGSVQFPTDSQRYTDNLVLNKVITVVGKYPASEVRCAALMCDCDDAIVIEDLQAETEAIPDAQLVELEGKMICLPHKGEASSQTLECSFGFQTVGGQKYFLMNVGERLGGSQQIGLLLKVRALLTKPDKNTIYDVDGSLDVIYIEQLN